MVGVIFDLMEIEKSAYRLSLSPNTNLIPTYAIRYTLIRKGTVIVEFLYVWLGLVAIVLVMAFPAIALWLPELMR